MSEFCCEDFRKNTGTRHEGLELHEGVWHVNGCCHGGCCVLNNIRFCPFCGTSLATAVIPTVLVCKSSDRERMEAALRDSLSEEP